MIKKILLLTVTVILMFSFMSIDLGAEVKLKGLFQGWFSYADQEGSEDNGYGFTIRRMRLKPYGSLGKNITWGFQVGWDKQNAALLDAYMNFKLSDQFQIKMGQFSAPGSVSGALTSSGKLDMVERPMVSQKWGGNNALFGYRALGVQAHGNLANGKLYYAVMLANPNTSSLFTPGIKSSTYAHDENGIALWTRLEAKPTKCIRVGGFFGTSKDDDDYITNSYGGHFFFAKKGINLKVEYIGGEYGFENLETKYYGIYALLGYKIKNVEPMIRYGCYRPNDGDPDSYGVERYRNITIGVNYFHSKSIKFQVNYVLRSETMFEGMDELENNLFYLCFQYTYN